MNSAAPINWSQYQLGIFDTGQGGRDVATYLARALPGLGIVNFSDPDNLPYGNKTLPHIWQCLQPFLEECQTMDLDAMLIACNTVFINFGPQIKAMLDIPVLGYSPHLILEEILPQSQTKIIGCCATQATLQSVAWQKIKEHYAPRCQILDFDCSHWAALVEYQQITLSDLAPILDEIILRHVDSLILGCTHFHSLKKDLLQLKPPDDILNIYEPSEQIALKLKQILHSLLPLNMKNPTTLRNLTSGRKLHFL